MWLPHKPASVAVSEAVDTGSSLSPNQVEPMDNSTTVSSRQKLRTRNLDSNVAHGDPLCVDKPENLTHLVVQNTNGFQLVDSNGGTFQVVMHTLARLGTDIAAFLEINLDTQSHRRPGIGGQAIVHAGCPTVLAELHHSSRTLLRQVEEHRHHDD